MRTILVFGDKNFKLEIPDHARITFGPWSPPNLGRFHGDDDKRGTLRVYGKSKEDILAVFSGVTGFRDTSLGYHLESPIEKALAKDLWEAG